MIPHPCSDTLSRAKPFTGAQPFLDQKSGFVVPQNSPLRQRQCFYAIAETAYRLIRELFAARQCCCAIASGLLSWGDAFVCGLLMKKEKEEKYNKR